MLKRYLHTFLSFLILCCGFKGYSQTYCSITGSTSSATYINNFRTTGGITNITNNATGFSPGGYNNATDKSVTQVNGGSVNFTSTTAGGTVGFTIWVDWNDNGVFDANERVYTSGAGSYVTSPSGSFTVPASALIAAASGTATRATFRLTGYNGLITGWEVSTDSTFATNVKKTYNLADTFAFNDTVNAVTYVRALVQTGGCAITGSKPAVIRQNCNNLIKNGSFEDPALAGTTYAFRKIPNWTNTVDNNTMELHRLSLGPAANGSQYIEMNGYNFGNIYQDFTAAGGQDVKWSLDHKKRYYANEVITVTLSAPDGSNASAPVQHLATAAWQKVSGSYQLAPGQTQVRIRIVSSGGVAAAGNLLDNVQAQYATCAGITAMREGAAVAGEAPAGNLSMIIHPNPVSAMADLRMEGFATGKVSVDVMNSNGQLVHSTDVQYTEGTSIHMDLSHLHQGMYFVRVKQDGKVVTAKMVKN